MAKTHEFALDNLTIRFVEQDDPARIAIGELFHSLRFIPKNATGDISYFQIGQWPQIRRAVLNAGIEFLMSPPKFQYFHPRNNMMPQKDNLFRAWAHFSVFTPGLKTIFEFDKMDADGKPIKGPDGKVLKNFVVCQNPSVWDKDSNARVAKIDATWYRLREVAANLWQALPDNTILPKTGYGNATLKHSYLAMLFGGEALELYPWIEDNKNGHFEKAQNRTKWLFKLCQRVASQETTEEEERDKFFESRIAWRIAHDLWEETTEDDEFDKELDTKTVQNGIAIAQGKDLPNPEVETYHVKVDGTDTLVTEIAKKVYTASAKKVKLGDVNLGTLQGYRQLAQYHNKYSINLRLTSKTS